MAAGSSSPGMAAAARASPANKASRRRHLRPWIGRTGTVASDVYMPNPARMVIDRRSDAQWPSPTRRRTQGDRHATRTHRRGQVAGSPDRGRAGDGDSNQLLAVPRGHRPHGGGRQRVEVTVSLTLLAVARAEPGWPQPDRYHRWAAVLGSGSFGRCSGGCWPASPKVALAGVAASRREHAIRVRGRATTVIPRPPPRAFPANLGPTERRSASPPSAGRAMLSSGHTCRWRVVRAGPL